MKNNIRHIRESKGYSQKYVATRLGKSQPLLSKIENGYTHLSEKAIEQLSQILEVAEEELLNEEMEGANSLNSLINHLFNQFKENKKLLYEVEVNQKKLEEQLDQLFSLIVKST